MSTSTNSSKFLQVPGAPPPGGNPGRLPSDPGRQGSGGTSQGASRPPMTDAERKEDDGLQLQWSKLRTEYYLSLIKRQGSMSAEEITSLLQDSESALQCLKTALEPIRSRLCTIDGQIHTLNQPPPENEDDLDEEYKSLFGCETYFCSGLEKCPKKPLSSWNSMEEESRTLAGSATGSAHAHAALKLVTNDGINPSTPAQTLSMGTWDTLWYLWSRHRLMDKHQEKWGRLCTCPRPPSWKLGDPYTPVSSIQTDAQGAQLTKDPKALPVNASQV